jgi:hypothetical protein
MPPVTVDKGTLTQPTVRAVGTSSAGATSSTPGLPAGLANNDVMFAFFACPREFDPITSDVEWYLVGAIDVGSVGAVGSISCTVYWKRVTNAVGETAPTFTIASPGDHIIGAIVAVQNASLYDPPFENIAIAGGTPTTTVNFPLTYGTISGESRLLFHSIGYARDIAGGVQFSNWRYDVAGANTLMSENVDASTATGHGSAIGVASLTDIGVANSKKGGQVTIPTVIAAVEFVFHVRPLDSALFYDTDPSDTEHLHSMTSPDLVEGGGDVVLTYFQTRFVT